MMMAWEDDMVIADRIRQEVGSLAWVRQLNNLLGPAQVWLGLASDQFALFDEAAGEIAGDLEDGDRAFLHIPSDADTDA